MRLRIATTEPEKPVFSRINYREVLEDLRRQKESIERAIAAVEVLLSKSLVYAGGNDNAPLGSEASTSGYYPEGGSAPVVDSTEVMAIDLLSHELATPESIRGFVESLKDAADGRVVPMSEVDPTL